jgi:hypothetical protein
MCGHSGHQCFTVAGALLSPTRCLQVPHLSGCCTATNRSSNTAAWSFCSSNSNVTVAAALHRQHSQPKPASALPPYTLTARRHPGNKQRSVILPDHYSMLACYMFASAACGKMNNCTLALALPAELQPCASTSCNSRTADSLNCLQA